MNYGHLELRIEERSQRLGFCQRCGTIQRTANCGGVSGRKFVTHIYRLTNRLTTVPMQDRENWKSLQSMRVQTERYARWCERTAVSHRLLLDLESVEDCIHDAIEIVSRQ